MPFVLGILLEEALEVRPAPLLVGGLAALGVRALGPRRARTLSELVALLLIGASALSVRLHAPVPAVGDDPVVLTVAASPSGDGTSCVFSTWLHGERPGRARLRTRGELCGALPGSRWLARVELWPPRGPRNPGAIHGARRARRRGVRMAGSVGDAAPLGPPPGGPRALLERLRRRVGASLDPRDVPGPRAGPLLRALATADRDRLAPELRDGFRRSGTAHLLAVSGLHVGLVFGLAHAVTAWLARRSRRNSVLRRVNDLATASGAAAALAYAALAGFGVPALRAAAMALAGSLAVLGGRPGRSVNALAAAALLVLALDPAALLEPALALSFIAVVGILAWRPGGGKLARLLGCTLGASLATGPLLAALEIPLPAGALLANALAVPWFGGIVVPLALVAGVVGAALPGIAAALRVPALVAAELGLQGLELLRSPDLVAGLAAPTATALCGSSVAFALRLARRRARAAACGLAALAVVAAVTAVASRTPGAEAAEADPWLLFLDVGHGDAVIARSAGRAWLIDAGPRLGGFDAGHRVVLPALRAEGIEELDVLVVTHADADHVGGARAVVEALPVGEVWLAPQALDAPGVHPLRLAAARRGVPVRVVTRGERRAFGPLWVDVLWPPADHAQRSPNASSLVLRIEGRGACATLPGDVPARVERLIAPGLAPCELLELAHHGSASSSDWVWLERLQPVAAIASAGRRRPPLPHVSVRDRLDRAAVTLWETHRFGAIRVWLGPRGIAIAPHLLPPAERGGG